MSLPSLEAPSTTLVRQRLESQVALPPLPPSQSTAGKSSRRLARMSVGFGLLSFAIWSMGPLLFNISSTQAVVNAPVITIRAPSAGIVGGISQSDGFGHNLPQLRIEATRADEQFEALQAEEEAVGGRIDSLCREREALDVLVAQLQSTSQQYLQSTVRRLQMQVKGAKASTSAAQALAQQRILEKELAEQLARSHSVSNQELQTAQLAAATAQQLAIAAQFAADRCEEELSAVQHGVQALEGNGSADMPYSSQRIHELTVRKIQLSSAQSQEEAKLVAIKRQISNLNQRRSRRQAFAAELPQGAFVWRRHVVPGSSINIDAPVVDCVDMQHAFIDAIVHQKYLSNIQSGDDVSVRFVGTSDELPAQVVAVCGTSIPWSDSTLAVPALVPGKQDVHIVLHLSDERALYRHDQLAIGLPVVVTFADAIKSLRQYCGLK